MVAIVTVVALVTILTIVAVVIIVKKNHLLDLIIIPLVHILQ